MALENNKRVARNTLFLYIRMGITMLITLYTSRIVLAELGFDDYGIYNVVAGIVSLFAFLNGALGAATSRFITFELGRQNEQVLRKIFRSAFTIHILLALVVVVLAETIGLWFVNDKLVVPYDRLFAANVVYQFAVLSCAISIIQVPFNAEIIAHEKMGVFACIGIVDAVLKLMIAFVIGLDFPDKLIVYSGLIFLLVLMTCIFLYFYSRRNFEESVCNFLFDRTLFRNMLSYSGWSLLGSLAYALKFQGINVVLNLFYGPIVNAACGVAYQVNTAISSFTQNFTIALNPQIIKSYAIEDFNRTVRLLVRGTKFSYFLLLFFAVPVLIETPYILSLWLKDVPEYAVSFVRLIVVNSLLDSFSPTIGASVQATGKIMWYQIIVGGILLLNLPIAYILLKMDFTPNAVFLLSIGLTFLSLIARTVILKKLLGVSISDFGIHVLGISILVSILSFLFPCLLVEYMEAGILRFMSVVAGGCMSVLLFVGLVGTNKQERLFVKNTLINFFSRKIITE